MSDAESAGIAMRHTPPRLASLLVLLGAAGVPAVASAQTTTGPTVSANPNQAFPERFINGQDVGQSQRPINLTPLGVNYSDCVQDMVLRYNVQISGFSGQSLQVWASTAGTCTTDANRGNGGVANCWLVGNAGAINQALQQAVTINVPVRSIVGPQQESPSPAGQVTGLDATACNAQATDAPVTFTIFILPIQSPNTYVGTGFQQSLTTDLVGPPPPVNVSLGVGDTFLGVRWTPNIDSDTAGYDVFVDPIPGTTTLASASVSASTSAGLTTICPGSSSTSSSATSSSTGTSSSSAASSSVAGSTDTSSSTSSTLDVDAGCYVINIGSSAPANGASNCPAAPALTSGIVQDGGGVTTGVTTDDSGAGTTSDAGGTFGTGGIATIPCDYLVGTSCPSGQPVYTAFSDSVPSETSGSYNVAKLTNGVQYNVVVAAVDNSGNVGPPSGQQCQTPEPVNDFYKVYRNAGGTAGGSFCALEAVGAPVGGTAALGGIAIAAGALLRRRKRRLTR